MIKVSVFYPWAAGATFDMDYYCTKHMALVRKCMGKAIKGIAVDQGLAGDTPGSKPSYVAIGHVMFDSIEDVRKSFGLHAETIMADVANYTTIEPIVQVSEVRM